MRSLICSQRCVNAVPFNFTGIRNGWVALVASKLLLVLTRILQLQAFMEEISGQADAPQGSEAAQSAAAAAQSEQHAAKDSYRDASNLGAFRWMFMRPGTKPGAGKYAGRALLMLSPLMVCGAILLCLSALMLGLLLSPHATHMYTLARMGLASAWVPEACPKARHTYTPTSEQEVVSIVMGAVQACPKGGLSIRASRQGWHSNAPFPCVDDDATCDSIQLDMSHMDKVLEVDEAKRLVRVQPGALVANVMDALFLHNHLNFRPERMTIYTGLTVGGMVLSAAHGSSILKPSAFGNLLEGLSFVDGKGKLRKVSGPEAREFIGSTGMFGIVTELTLRVDEPIKHFMSVMKRSDARFEEDLPDLLAGTKPSGNSTFQRSLWFPHAGMMLTKQHIDMPPDVPGDAKHTFFHSKPLFAIPAAVGIKLDQLNFLQGILPTDKLICFTMRNVPGVWYSEHASYVPWNESFVGWAHDLTGSSCLGNQYGCYWHDMAQVLVELDMPWDNLLPWMQDIRKLVSFAPGCLPSLLGFTLRFGRGSDHPLDMAYGRDTVYVDILVSKGFSWLPAVHQDLFDEIEQVSLLKYNARPHWGKNPTRAFLDPRAPVRDKYPLFEDMLAKAGRFDPHGIFLSPMHKAMIAREGPDRIMKHLGKRRCALHYLCYCSKDEDCGLGHKCTEGRLYPEYKVCRRKRLALG